METYNYLESVTNDVKDYLRDNYNREEFAEQMENREEFEESLRDDLWVADSVTGNASGSYWCNTWKAEEALCHNFDLYIEACEEFGFPEARDWSAEGADVTIRCYLLGNAISDALDEIEEEFEEE